MMTSKAFSKIVWHAGEPPAVLQGEPVPLKIGIFDDLVALAKSQESKIRKALHSHCRSKLYLAELLVDQAMRHDIDGNPVEPVSEGAKIAAAALMNYRLANPNKKPAEAPAPPANEPTGEAPAEPPKGNGAGAAVEWSAWQPHGARTRTCRS